MSSKACAWPSWSRTATGLCQPAPRCLPELGTGNVWVCLGSEMVPAPTPLRVSSGLRTGRLAGGKPLKTKKRAKFTQKPYRGFNVLGLLIFSPTENLPDVSARTCGPVASSRGPRGSRHAVDKGQTPRLSPRCCPTAASGEARRQMPPGALCDTQLCHSGFLLPARPLPPDSSQP